jgi:hypothetical protein
MPYIDPERIQKFENNKSALIFSDKLKMITKEEGDENGDYNICSLHSKFSKVKITAIDFSKGKGESAVVVDINIDPKRLKSISSQLKRFKPIEVDQGTSVDSAPKETAESITLGFGKYKGMTPEAAISKDGKDAVEELKRNLVILEKNLIGKFAEANKKKIEGINRSIAAFEKDGKVEDKSPAQSIEFINETKINPYKKTGNVSMLRINYNGHMRNPWNVSIEEGTAKIVDGIKTEGYKRLKKVDNIYISDSAFRDLIACVSRYVEQKEATFISLLNNELEQYREKYRKKDGEDEDKKRESKEEIKKTEEEIVRELMLAKKTDEKTKSILSKIAQTGKIEQLKMNLEFVATNDKGKKIQVKINDDGVNITQVK